MTVQNNAWSSWSKDLNDGYNFVNSINKQTTDTQNQLNTLITDYQNKTITMDQFQSESAPLIKTMNDFVGGLSTQYADISSNNPLFAKVAGNLNTAWQSTLQTFGNIGAEVPNPDYPKNSNQPTIPVQYNSDGTVTVSFTAPFSHNNTGGGCYLNGVQNLSWLPQANSNDRVEWNDGTGNYSDDFSLPLSYADDQGPQTCTFNGETIKIASNGDGTMTITITGSPSSFSVPNSTNNPSTSALTTFLQSPFG